MIRFHWVFCFLIFCAYTHGTTPKYSSFSNNLKGRKCWRTKCTIKIRELNEERTKTEKLGYFRMVAKLCDVTRYVKADLRGDVGIFEISPAEMALIAINFEIFGKVQGVSFRYYTQRKARSLGLRGWVQNTERDTVIGQLQGEAQPVNEMKEWLKNTGSPSSRIDKAVFTNEQTINQTTFPSFDVRKSTHDSRHFSLDEDWGPIYFLCQAFDQCAIFLTAHANHRVKTFTPKSE